MLKLSWPTHMTPLPDITLFLSSLFWPNFPKEQTSLSHFLFKLHPPWLSCHASMPNQCHQDTISKWPFWGVVVALLPLGSICHSELCFPARSTFLSCFHDTCSSSNAQTSLLLLHLPCQLLQLYPTRNVNIPWCWSCTFFSFFSTEGTLFILIVLNTMYQFLNL